jgi:hypothetical protein
VTALNRIINWVCWGEAASDIAMGVTSTLVWIHAAIQDALERFATNMIHILLTMNLTQIGFCYISICYMCAHIRASTTAHIGLFARRFIGEQFEAWAVDAERIEGGLLAFRPKPLSCRIDKAGCITG